MKSKEYQKAVSYCYRLLSRRDYTTYELKSKLRLKKFTLGIIEKVLLHLEERKYVDDIAFSKNWIEQRVRLKPCGRTRLYYELRRKGISESIIETALQQFQEQHNESELCQRAAKKYCSHRIFQDNEQKKRRVYNFLKRRGFSSSAIFNCLHKLDIID